MILRRIATFFRRQDCGAVAIELVVVVVGVFIGLQAANWNEDRLSAKRGILLSQRLKNDLRVEAWNYEMQIGYHGQVRANAIRAADALSGRGELTDEALLVAAYRATQYNDNTRQRTTYDELTSTGEMGLVDDPALRKLAMEVYSTSIFELIAEEGRASQYRQSFRKRVPHHAQAAVADTCGDRIVHTGDFYTILAALDYPCEVDLPAADIAAAAAILRTDPDVLPLLRLRIADIGTSISNLDTYYAAVREDLRRLAAEDR